MIMLAGVMDNNDGEMLMMVVMLNITLLQVQGFNEIQW